MQNERELRERVRWVIRSYHQPALVETYLPGREFTVGVMGRSDARRWTRRPGLYRADGFHRFPILEVDNHNTVTPGVYGHQAKTLHPGDAGIPDFICPAEVDRDLAEELRDLAIRAHQAIGALDVSRVDVRLDADGKPRLLEINTLPGLTPGFSDLCISAEAEGLSYTDLILEDPLPGRIAVGPVGPAARGGARSAAHSRTPRDGGAAHVRVTTGCRPETATLDLPCVHESTADG